MHELQCTRPQHYRFEWSGKNTIYMATSGLDDGFPLFSVKDGDREVGDLAIGADPAAQLQ